MKPKGIHRLVLVVRDMGRFEKAVAFYSELLGATFQDPVPGADFYGVRAACSWDAGIEIITPLPGATALTAQSYVRFLREHGEGLYGAVVLVDDIRESIAKSEKMGLRAASPFIELDKDQIRDNVEGRFKIFKEYMLEPEDAYGVGIVLGEIEPK